MAASLIESGATVIIPSRFQEKLDELRDKLGSPAGLCTLHGGFADDDSNVVEKIKYEFGKIDGVIAHGGLIRSDTLGTGVVGKSILKVSPEEVLEDTRILLRLHLTAAQALIPMLESKIETESWKSYPPYTFLTGGLRETRGNFTTGRGSCPDFLVWFRIVSTGSYNTVTSESK